MPRRRHNESTMLSSRRPEDGEEEPVFGEGARRPRDGRGRPRRSSRGRCDGAGRRSRRRRDRGRDFGHIPLCALAVHAVVEGALRCVTRARVETRVPRDRDLEVASVLACVRVRQAQLVGLVDLGGLDDRGNELAPGDPRCGDAGDVHGVLATGVTYGIDVPVLERLELDEHVMVGRPHGDGHVVRLDHGVDVERRGPGGGCDRRGGSRRCVRRGSGAAGPLVPRSDRADGLPVGGSQDIDGDRGPRELRPVTLVLVAGAPTDDGADRQRERGVEGHGVGQPDLDLVEPHVRRAALGVVRIRPGRVLRRLEGAVGHAGRRHGLHLEALVGEDVHVLLDRADDHDDALPARRHALGVGVGLELHVPGRLRPRGLRLSSPCGPVPEREHRHEPGGGEGRQGPEGGRGTGLTHRGGSGESAPARGRRGTRRAATQSPRRRPGTRGRGSSMYTARCAAGRLADPSPGPPHPGARSCPGADP